MKRTYEEVKAYCDKEIWLQPMDLNNVDLYKFMTPYDKKKELEFAAFLEWYNELEVGDHACIQHCLDLIPVTVVSRTNDTITVRYDKAELLTENPTDKNQEWNISEDPNGETQIFKMTEVGWRNMETHESVYPGWDKHIQYSYFR